MSSIHLQLLNIYCTVQKVTDTIWWPVVIKSFRAVFIQLFRHGWKVDFFSDSPDCVFILLKVSFCQGYVLIVSFPHDTCQHYRIFQTHKAILFVAQRPFNSASHCFVVLFFSFRFTHRYFHKRCACTDKHMLVSLMYCGCTVVQVYFHATAHFHC